METQEKKQTVIYRLHSKKENKVIYVRSLLMLNKNQFIEHPTGVYAVDEWDYAELLKSGNIVIDCQEEDTSHVFIHTNGSTRKNPVVYIIEDKKSKKIRSIEENIVVLNNKFDSVYGKCKIYNRAPQSNDQTVAVFAKKI